ncbi:MAG: lanthionine synthetase LanC family protein [Bryobacteraceae bacterium]|jgi:type 2 lantibiotic biosynthesis protein LanM
MNPDYLDIAGRIAARLCRDALWSRGRCNWTADFLEEDGIAHGALGPSLYAGTSGIALFLSRMASATGERIFRLTADGALRQALEKLPAAGLGLYSGGLGIHYVAVEMGREIDEDAVIRQAAPRRSELDVIGGSAGAIATLLYLHRRTRSARLLEAAIEHGDLLLAEASKEEHGWSWRNVGATRNLTGFSHGAAGIGWALAELYAATEESRFRAAAREAFRYERSCWNPAERNWPDFRGAEPAYPVFWCHGAAGIAFSRLRAWQILGDSELLAEALSALATVQEDMGSPQNYSLCHGEMGNADLLIHASEILHDEAWLAPARAAAQEGFERFERRRVPWPCGLPEANETPDLMLGLAGIGHFYLRISDPPRTPTVLLPTC